MGPCFPVVGIGERNVLSPSSQVGWDLVFPGWLVRVFFSDACFLLFLSGLVRPVWRRC